MMFKKILFVGGTIASGLLVISNVKSIPEVMKTALSFSQDPMSITKKWNFNWDLDADDTKLKDSKATRHLILIRHGQYVFQDDDKRCKLTMLGRDQANETGKRLLISDFKYDAMVHSNLTRAVETTSIISKHIPQVKVTLDPDLEEGVPFINEPSLPHWNPTADIIKSDNKRIETAFKRYFHRAPPSQDKDSYTILVCHANVIRYMICRALQFPPEGWIRFSLDHGSISWVSIKPNGVVVVRSIGNSGFMPVDFITSS